jgi:hypothetical protein
VAVRDDLFGSDRPFERGAQRPQVQVAVDAAELLTRLHHPRSARHHLLGTTINAWHNAFNRLQRCYERRETVINAFVDLADAIITVRSLIRKSWITHRWDTRPIKSP